MDFTYYSPQRVGPIESGMSRSTIRRILNVPFDAFRKTEFSTNTTDAFDTLGAHVYYDENDIVKGMEIFPPNGDLLYCKLRLVGQPFAKVIAALESAGARCLIESAGASVDSDSIRLYSPEADDDVDATVESVYVVMLPLPRPNVR